MFTMRFYQLLSFICGGLAAATDLKCHAPPLDVFFLQDSTSSFKEVLKTVAEQIPSMVEQILSSNPDSLFGVAEMKDKPYYPLGDWIDFCYKLNEALTPSMEQFHAAYSDLYASGGGDAAHAQLEALLDVAEDPRVGWRQSKARASTDEPFDGASVVIMFTDAPPHLNGDIAKFHDLYPNSVPGNLQAHPGSAPGADYLNSCRSYDYPSPMQVRKALQDRGIFVAILTPDDANTTEAWRSFNEDILGQPEELYQIINSKSCNFTQGVINVIEKVTEMACENAKASTCS